MNPQAAQQYLKTRVLTATPEQLQMMLYDGALRFGEQARAALEKKQYDQSYALIVRVQRIITELSSSLKHDVSPDLCGKLAALYNYAYRQLIEANVSHSLERLDDAMSVLRYQRETWDLLLKQLSRQKMVGIAGRMDLPAPDARMEASISMQG